MCIVERKVNLFLKRYINITKILIFMNRNIAIIKRYDKRREKSKKIFNLLLFELTAFINPHITPFNHHVVIIRLKNRMKERDLCHTS